LLKKRFFRVSWDDNCICWFEFECGYVNVYDCMILMLLMILISYDFLNEAVDDPLQLLFLLLTADEWRFSVQRIGDVLTRVSMIILLSYYLRMLAAMILLMKLR